MVRAMGSRAGGATERGPRGRSLRHEPFDATRKRLLELSFGGTVQAFDENAFLVDEKTGRRRVDSIRAPNDPAGIAAHREGETIVFGKLPRC